MKIKNNKKKHVGRSRSDPEAPHKNLPDHDKHATLRTLTLTHDLIQVTEYYMDALTLFTKEKGIRIEKKKT